MPVIAASRLTSSERGIVLVCRPARYFATRRTTPHVKTAVDTTISPYQRMISASERPSKTVRVSGTSDGHAGGACRAGLAQ